MSEHDTDPSLKKKLLLLAQWQHDLSQTDEAHREPPLQLESFERFRPLNTFGHRLLLFFSNGFKKAHQIADLQRNCQLLHLQSDSPKVITVMH